MKVKIIEKGRIDNKLSLCELTNSDMKKVKGGAICVCDANFCLDCGCILIGLCVCHENYNQC